MWVREALRTAKRLQLFVIPSEVEESLAIRNMDSNRMRALHSMRALATVRDVSARSTSLRARLSLDMTKK